MHHFLYPFLYWWTLRLLLYLCILTIWNWPHRRGFIFGLSILLHWSMCLFLCCFDYYSLVVQFDIRYRIWVPPNIFFPVRLLGLAGKFCGSTEVLIFVLVVRNMSLVSWYGLHWICRFLWIVQTFRWCQFFLSMSMVYLSIYLDLIQLHSSESHSFLSTGLLFLGVVLT